MLTKIIKNVYLIISFTIIFTSIYIKHSFYDVSFEQLLFTIINSEGTSITALLNGIFIVLSGIIIIFTLLFLLKKYIKKFKYQFYLIVSVKKKKNKRIRVFPFSKRQERIYCVLFFILSIIFACKYLGAFEYIHQQIERTTIFEDYYVNGKDISIIFPDKKRNLIYIFVESLESTNFSKSSGGIMEKSYIPHLETYANNYINFSNTNLLGGGYATTGSTWTVAGMVSQTAGIPLKLSVGNQYKGYGEFLPGAYTLGDVLLDNGYDNYLLLGSDSMFGGRKDYFKYHGNYQIHDYYWAIDNGLINSDYKEWWGFEDSKLYSYAKDELTKISRENKPFNYTILTADTHFTDGYLDSSCPTVFDKKYANVFNCTDLMLYDFICWIQEQDFYDNTTIVISGDHLTMQSNFYDISDESSRRVYNVFINSAIDTTNNNKNRIFTTLDMFPTTLASMGVSIEGDKLGLGTNLFSDKKTLAEELTIDYLNSEFEKRNNYYNLTLLGDSYFELEKNLEEE